jgi:hypothetical protein
MLRDPQDDTSPLRRREPGLLPLPIQPGLALDTHAPQRRPAGPGGSWSNYVWEFLRVAAKINHSLLRAIAIFCDSVLMGLIIAILIALKMRMAFIVAARKIIWSKRMVELRRA